MLKSEIAGWIHSGWEFILTQATWVKEFANSNFFTALCASLAGAVAGACVAQRTTERAKLREEMIREIRDTNAAIMLAFTICNSLLSLKKQHVKALKTDYDETRDLAIEHAQKAQSNDTQGKGRFKIKADLKTLPHLKLPTDALQKIVFERLPTTGRPLALVISLIEAKFSLNDVIEKRNKLIEQYQTSVLGNQEHFVALYLGLPDVNGHTNQEYPDAMNAIHSNVDEIIFFSNLLCRDLQQHGEDLAINFKREFRGPIPPISKVDFGMAHSAGLMPSEDDFADWLQGFAKKSDAQK